MKPAGLFTSKLWMAAQPVFEQIINCLYIRRLADGTLPKEWFAHYLSQDVLYIIDDSRALAVTAARAADPDEMYFLLELAKEGLDIERALHDEFLKVYALPEAPQKSPAFKAYSDFLLNNAFNSPYPVAVAALLPCFWVYYKTGEYVLVNSINNNPFRKWIDTYSGDAYIQYTERFIRITENLGQKADHKTRKQMEVAFTEGTKHELKVFEEASEQ
jgi:thiaminase/transcriptional activator TenA